MASPLLTLQQLARLHNVGEDRIRRYEAEGLLVPLFVGNNRFYTDRERVKLAIVLKGQKLGFSLSEIGKLIAVQLQPPAQVHGESEIAQAEVQIQKLEAEKAALQATIDRLRARIAKG